MMKKEKKMNNINDLLNTIISSDEEIKVEIELLDLKYKLIDELIKFRKSYKLSQSEFAETINVKQQMISRFEKGEVDPRLSFVSKLLLGMKKEICIRDKDYLKVQNISYLNKNKNIFLPTEYKLVG